MLRSDLKEGLYDTKAEEFSDRMDKSKLRALKILSDLSKKPPLYPFGEKKDYSTLNCLMIFYVRQAGFIRTMINGGFWGILLFCRVSAEAR